MNIVKFIFNRTYRKNITEKFSADIITRSYNAENDMENIYASISMNSQEIAA